MDFDLNETKAGGNAEYEEYKKRASSARRLGCEITKEHKE